MAGTALLRNRASSGRRISRPSAQALARGLGWFSIALGAVELLTPGAVTRRVGLQGHEGLAQLYGLREIGTGFAILSAQDPTPWIWGRVGGDALDIATAAGGLGRRDSRGGTVLALLSLAGVTALDVFCGRQLAAWRR